jgi:hypothetical protein
VNVSADAFRDAPGLEKLLALSRRKTLELLDALGGPSTCG